MAKGRKAAEKPAVKPEATKPNRKDRRRAASKKAGAKGPAVPKTKTITLTTAEALAIRALNSDRARTLEVKNRALQEEQRLNAKMTQLFKEIEERTGQNIDGWTLGAESDTATGVA